MNAHPGSDAQIVVIMGLSGSGKSTITALLAGHRDRDLQKGDDLHPSEKVATMPAGQPLTDQDRRPWLDAVASSPVPPSNAATVTAPRAQGRLRASGRRPTAIRKALCRTGKWSDGSIEAGVPGQREANALCLQVPCDGPP